MAKPSKDNHPITVRLSKSLLNELNEFVEVSGQTKTTVIERALRMYIDDYYNKLKILKEAKSK